jgi:hypothetical protein
MKLPVQTFATANAGRRQPIEGARVLPIGWRFIAPTTDWTIVSSL